MDKAWHSYPVPPASFLYHRSPGLPTKIGAWSHCYRVVPVLSVKQYYFNLPKTIEDLAFTQMLGKGEIGMG